MTGRPEATQPAWKGVAAVVAVGAPVVALLLVVALHFVQSETNDNDALSEYALGDYGWLMNVAFFATAAGFAALAVLLVVTLAPSTSGRIGVALLFVAAVAWLLLGAGNIDPEGAEQTFHGVVHGIGFLVGFPASFAAPLVLARAFRHDDGWRAFRRPTLALGLLALAAFVSAFMDAFSPITIRVAEGLLLLWVVLAGLRGGAISAP